MSELVFIGIDPGLSGAVAIIDGHRVWLHDAPVVKVKKTEYLPDQAADLLRPYTRRGYAILEAVSGRPGQGAASARSIGLGFGLWLGILASLEIPREMVQPGVWKRTFSLLGCDKGASRLRAQSLFPQVRDELRLVKHDGRAEALLMAEYARRRHGGVR